jgi:hypothetical protein
MPDFHVLLNFAEIHWSLALRTTLLELLVEDSAFDSVKVSASRRVMTSAAEFWALEAVRLKLDIRIAQSHLNHARPVLITSGDISL